MSTGNVPRQATYAQTHAAENRANQRLGELLETGAGHRCGRCANPFTGRSMIRCANDPGGK